MGDDIRTFLTVEGTAPCGEDANLPPSAQQKIIYLYIDIEDKTLLQKEM